MKNKKHLLLIFTYLIFLVLTITSICYFTEWSLFSVKNEVLYKITTPSSKTIELIKVMGDATSLDYFQVKIDQKIILNEIVYGGLTIDELYIRKDSITIQYKNSEFCINPLFFQASIE